MIPGTVSRAMAAGPACLVAGLGACAAGHGSWRAAAPMPIERTEVAAAALAGRIYVIGGFKMFFVGGVTNAVQEYDPVHDLWRGGGAAPRRSASCRRRRPRRQALCRRRVSGPLALEADGDGLALRSRGRSVGAEAR